MRYEHLAVKFSLVNSDFSVFPKFVEVDKAIMMESSIMAAHERS